MNPGNGIETLNSQDPRVPVYNCFLFMNPGNGIETLPILKKLLPNTRVSYL